jgi:hypothetical protein
MHCFDKNLSKLFKTITPEYTFISCDQNIDMAKGYRGRPNLPKKGVNPHNKRSSDHITSTDESTLGDKRKHKRVSVRSEDVEDDDSPPDVVNNQTGEDTPIPKRTIGRIASRSNTPGIGPVVRTSVAKGPRLNNVATTTAMPPPTQVFERSTLSSDSDNINREATNAANAANDDPMTRLYCAEDDESVLDDSSFDKPSVLLTTALAISRENVDMQLENRASLQNSTIMTLQNTNRDLLSDHEQAAQFTKWDDEITKIVGKIFHTTKFAYYHVSERNIPTVLLTKNTLTHNACFVNPIFNVFIVVPLY